MVAIEINDKYGCVSIHRSKGHPRAAVIGPHKSVDTFGDRQAQIGQKVHPMKIDVRDPGLIYNWDEQPSSVAIE